MTDILMIEDNKELGTILGDFLKKDGFSFYQAYSAEDGLEYLKSNEVKIILLDIMLPHMDGIAACLKIREHQSVPIIIVSAKTDKYDKLSGLMSGADDYIEKPFDIDIMLAKIRSIYKRNYDSAGVYIDDALELNNELHTVKLYGNPLTLTLKEFELLRLLLANKGKTLRKEWMFDKIWGTDSFSEPSTLTVHIKWLRDKIEKDPKNPTRIITVWGIGYRYESVIS